MNKSTLLFFAVFATVSAQESFDLQKAFQQASKSTLMVHSINRVGEDVAIGSGVVISRNEVVTNAHVILDGTSAYLTKMNTKWNVSKILVNNKLDLAILETSNLPFPPVKIAVYRSLKIGQKLFSIGNPRGLELTLSDGILSGFRLNNGITFIQTTTPISPGSSGGGVFNTKCELVGINTFLIKDSQNLNFAISSQHINDLTKNNIPLDEYISKIFIIKPEYQIDAGTIAYMSDENLLKLAAKNNAYAQGTLGLRYFYGVSFENGNLNDKKPKNIQEGVNWLTKAAENGDSKAADILIGDYISNPNTNINLDEAKRLVLLMLKTIDSKYDIMYYKNFSDSDYYSLIGKTSFDMYRVYYIIVGQNPNVQNIKELLTWQFIRIWWLNNQLNLFSGNLSEKWKINTRNGLLSEIESINKMINSARQAMGIEFIESAEARAKVLMNSYGISD